MLNTNCALSSDLGATHALTLFVLSGMVGTLTVPSRKWKYKEFNRLAQGYTVH